DVTDKLHRGASPLPQVSSFPQNPKPANCRFAGAERKSFAAFLALPPAENHSKPRIYGVFVFWHGSCSSSVNEKPSKVSPT
ncbi:MAG: hypothetical protein ACRERW_12200, partial [Pseudomonas sp.]